MTEILVVFADQEDEGAPDGLPDWDRSLAMEETSEWPWVITCIRYSVTSPPARDTDDIAQRPSGSTGQTPTEPIRTWDILARLEDPCLVHISRPYTRAGEVALLAAKLLGKKVVLSDFDHPTSDIGVSLGLVDLADCLVCQSAEEASSFADHARVEVLDSSSALHDIYRDLLNTAERSG